MILKFELDEQTLKLLPTQSVPRKGSRNYLKLKFAMSPLWQGLQTTAFLQFEGDCETEKFSEPIPIPASGEINVPNFFAAKPFFQIYLLGINGETAVPTNTLTVSLDASGESWVSVPEAPAMPDYQALMQLVNDALNRNPEVSEQLRAFENALSAFLDSALCGLPVVDPNAGDAFIPMHIIRDGDEAAGELVEIPSVKLARRIAKEELPTGILIKKGKIYLVKNGVPLGKPAMLDDVISFDSGYVDEGGYLHLTLEGEEIEGFTPFYIGSAAEAPEDLVLDGDRLYLAKDGGPMGEGVTLPEGGGNGKYYTPVLDQIDDTTVKISFAPSDPEMPAVPDVSVVLPEGIPGNPGKDGGFYIPSMEQVSETEVEVSFASQGGENMPQVESVTLTLPRGATGKTGPQGPIGPQGEQGPTGPQGDSYILTDSDKAEITRIMIESLGGNPVFGYVDKNNNIILSGNLADGTYTAKYEMEDGSTVDIGELVLDKNVYYSVTNTLTNCVSDNSTVQAIGGQNYSAVISANKGYELTSVVVTMGGTNISSSAVSGGTIRIAEVTGDIVIAAVAEKVVVITNFLEPNTDNTTDWNIWCNNARIGSDGAYRSSTTQDATNYISVQIGDIIHINQGRMINGQIIGLYGTNKAYVSAGSTTDLSNGGHISDATGINSATLDAQFTIANASVAFIRFTLNRGSYLVADAEIVVNIERNGEYL